jgi:CRISPR/Cas system CSM-associated protein Csm3 (group 7 of RAMP superfamily)
MHQWMTSMLRTAALGTAVLCGLGCATQGKPGFSIEATTGSRTGNPFEIHLTTSGSELKGVLVNRSSSEQRLLYNNNLQSTRLELISATGSVHKPYDSRKLKKLDTKPYCYLFQSLGPGKKRELGFVRFNKLRDGYAGQWGPFNFEEMPPGDYQARIIWQTEITHCFDESIGKMRKVSPVWRGIVRSNQVTLRLP